MSSASLFCLIFLFCLIVHRLFIKILSVKPESFSSPCIGKTDSIVSSRNSAHELLNVSEGSTMPFSTLQRYEGEIFRALARSICLIFFLRLKIGSRLAKKILHILHLCIISSFTFILKIFSTELP